MVRCEVGPESETNLMPQASLFFFKRLKVSELQSYMCM